MPLNSGMRWYQDSALTIPVTSLTFIQAVDDSLPLVNRRVYLGNPDDDFSYVAQSGPGVDQIVVSIDDEDPENDIEAEHVKLALTSDGLATATPGDPLNIGTVIEGGAGNGIAVWVSLVDLDLAQGSYTTIKLSVNTLAEFLS